MDNLMKLLGSPDESDKKMASAPDAQMGEDDAQTESDDGFEAAAEECMTAMQGGDAQGFAEALKHCIELSQ